MFTQAWERLVAPGHLLGIPHSYQPIKGPEKSCFDLRELVNSNFPYLYVP